MPRPDIFGVGMASLIDNAMRDAGGSFPCTLKTKRSSGRDPLNPTSGAQTVETSHSARGFLDRRARKISPALGVMTMGDVFSIFGGSLPDGVEPQPGDEIISPTEGETFRIIGEDDGGGVNRDPAGAVYECAVVAIAES